MSDTPRTDAELPVYHGFPSTVSREFARTLERELSAQEVQMNAVRYRAEKAERELAAAQSDLATANEAWDTLFKHSQENAAEIARLAKSNAELRGLLGNVLAHFNGPEGLYQDARRALSGEGE